MIHSKYDEMGNFRMFNCQFRECEKEATTKGIVFVMNEGGKDKAVEVYACDKHKKVTSFFESPKG